MSAKSAPLSYAELQQAYSVAVSENQTLRSTLDFVRQERDHFKAIFENQPVGLYRIRVFNANNRKGKSWNDLHNPPYVVEFATDKFCEQLGVSRSEFDKNPYKITSFIHPDDISDFAKQNEEANAKFTTFIWEGRLKINKRIVWVRFDSIPTRLEDGDILWTGILTDITSQKKAEDELEKFKSELDEVIEGANIGTLEWNIQTGKLKYNKIWAKNLGYTTTEIKIGTLLFGKKGWKAITHPDDIAYAEEMLQRHFAGEIPYHKVEVRMRHKKGHWVWIRQEGKLKTRTPDGKPLLMYGVHMDISAQKEAEIALFKLNEELESRIAKRTEDLTRLNTSLQESENKLLNITMEVEERERNRFSAELHDGMGPLLSTIKLYFQWLADTTDIDKRKLIIEKGSNSIEMAIQTARELARGLTSQYMKEVGFIRALLNFTEQICDTGVLCIQVDTNTNNRFNDIVELMLYRISTELIKNTLTHSGASQVFIKIQLDQDMHSLKLTYSDNGKGFDKRNLSTNSPGFGFISIRKRVEIMKGTINIVSEPGKGMQAEITAPLN